MQHYQLPSGKAAIEYSHPFGEKELIIQKYTKRELSAALIEALTELGEIKATLQSVVYGPQWSITGNRDEGGFYNNPKYEWILSELEGLLEKVES